MHTVLTVGAIFFGPFILASVSMKSQALAVADAQNKGGSKPKEVAPAADAENPQAADSPADPQ